MSLPRRNGHAISELVGIEAMELVAGVLVGYPVRQPPVPARKGQRIQWVGFSEERAGKWLP